MKSNLDKLFKNNQTLEKEGIEYEVSDGISFIVKRWNGFSSFEVKQKLAHKYKPFVRQIEQGTISEDKAREITLSLFVECCIVDWKGVEIDGELKPFSKEACIELLKRLPDLGDSLLAHAADGKNYREELGNF
jgi:hypothetical protein